jgi:hypothetical protein
MKIKNVSLLTFAILIILLNIPVKGIELVKGGKAECSIVLSSQPSESARLAAEELAIYINKISGAELRTIKGEDEKGIIVGTPKTLSNIPADMKALLKKCDNEDAFYIKTIGESVFIIGKNPIGALYGSYAFLEDYLGVRWYHPGELGEYYPEMKSISIRRINDFQKPDMKTRITALHTASYNFYDSVMWCARNRMHNKSYPAFRWFDGCTKERAEFLNKALNTINVRGGHLIFELAVPDELFENHPEYFTLRDGKRKFGHRLQRCVSNPEVTKKVAEYGLNWCNSNSNNVFSISSHDLTDSWCQCEKCIKMGTVNGKFKITNLYHRFVSQVVDYITKHNPDARIDVYFYIEYGVAPDDKTIKYTGKNVRGIYCTCFPHTRCYAHYLDDENCVLNKKCLADMKDVLKICPRLYTYEYMPSAKMRYRVC